MKYYEMHDEVYENISRVGKVSWDGLDTAEELFNHEINLAIANRVDHYFPRKENKKAIDFGCGTGTVTLYLANLGFEVKGFDISPKAIEMANENKTALKLNAEFKACDLTELNNLEADLTVDSSLLHCLVEREHRKKFFDLCSDLTFIHRMIESEHMSEMTGRDYIFGDDFSIVDAYMFVVLDWLNWVYPNDKLKVSNYNELDRYVHNLKKRSSVASALDYEANQFNQ